MGQSNQELQVFKIENPINYRIFLFLFFLYHGTSTEYNIVYRPFPII